MRGEAVDRGPERVGPAKRIEGDIANHIEGRNDEPGAAHNIARGGCMGFKDRHARETWPKLRGMDLHAIEAQPLDRCRGRLDVVAPSHQRHADELAVIGLGGRHRCEPARRSETSKSRSPIRAIR